MFKFVILAAFVATALAIEVTLCPGQPGPVSFAIRECPSLPCDVSVGQPINLVIGIHLESQATALPVNVIVTSEGREFPFELPNGDACAAIAGGCPAAPGNHVINFPVTIAGVNPGAETTVRVQFNNQAGQTVACGAVTTTFS